jgi:hypothetical protein
VSKIIDLGCRVADIHHRYHAIHDALFGAASFRLLIDALRGRRRRAYSEFSQSLTELKDELNPLLPKISDLEAEPPAKVRDRELQHVLLAYAEALGAVIEVLRTIFVNLEKDETVYRETGPDGRSGFTRDKVQYDQRLLELERLGTRLNRLFSNY